MNIDPHKPTIFMLMGPTASGKTDLVTKLYQNYPIDIISVDSAMIYKDMNIGTAKPTLDELKITPHFLIDIIEPTKSYSVGDFLTDSTQLIQQSLTNKRIPFLVGGTMLYFKSLVDGLSDLPKADPNIRQEIELCATKKGWNFLHEKLQKIDPISANRIHENDPQRLSRALEVFFISGKTLTELTQKKTNFLNANFVQFAIAPNSRQRLHEKIEIRFHKMLDFGFENEVQCLHEKYILPLNLPSMRSVGYKQMSLYLQGKISRNEMIFQSICATRQLAKRQITWLRKWNNILWLETEKSDICQKTVENLLKQVKF